MGWHKYIGVDSNLLKKVDPKQTERQTYILSSLTLMLFVISGICFFSSMVFSLIIFNSWLIALCFGVFLAIVVFNLYRLIVMTALDVTETSLEHYYGAHEEHYKEHINLNDDFSKLSDEKINEIVNNAKNKLREKTEMAFPNGNPKKHPLTMALRVFILSVIALVFCNGFELYLFQNQINKVLEELLLLYTSNNETWIIENMLTPTNGLRFNIIDTNSLLLALEILNLGLGYWKFLIDLIFIIIFLLPLIIVIKSKEIKKSEYVRELALSELTITFYHYLHTQKFCKEIIEKIKANEIVFSKNNKSV